MLLKQPILLYVYTSIGEGGIEPDTIEAGKIFTELAEQGHPFAQVSQDRLLRLLIFFSESQPVARSVSQLGSQAASQ